MTLRRTYSHLLHEQSDLEQSTRSHFHILRLWKSCIVSSMTNFQCIIHFCSSLIYNEELDKSGQCVIQTSILGPKYEKIYLHFCEEGTNFHLSKAKWTKTANENVNVHVQPPSFYCFVSINIASGVFPSRDGDIQSPNLISFIPNCRYT